MQHWSTPLLFSTSWSGQARSAAESGAETGTGDDRCDSPSDVSIFHLYHFTISFPFSPFPLPFLRQQYIQGLGKVVAVCLQGFNDERPVKAHVAELQRCQHRTTLTGGCPYLFHVFQIIRLSLASLSGLPGGQVWSSGLALRRRGSGRRSVCALLTGLRSRTGERSVKHRL
jgi:hypothetical protein